MRLVVAAATLWVLFGSGLMLNTLGQRRLMRIADGLLGVEFVALIAANSPESDGAAVVMALAVCPRVTGGFLAHCVQRALRGAREGPRPRNGARGTPRRPRRCPRRAPGAASPSRGASSAAGRGRAPR